MSQTSGDLPKTDPDQGLFAFYSPREIAESIGLDWWAALKLYDDGWLSFNPALEQIDDAGKEEEFVFLGSLVAAGCDPPMLTKLLAGLSKPYRYDLNRAYYDWRQQEWRSLPQIPSPEDSLASWVAELVEQGDVGTLSEIMETAREALSGLGEEDGAK